MSPDELAEVRLGDRSFSYSKRNIYTRCNYVCGGYAGLDRSGKWSTWSPSRYPIPEKDEDFQPAFEASAEAYTRRPMKDHLYYNAVKHNAVKPGFQTEYTCSHCQLVCHPDKKVRNDRYRMIMYSGVIVQNVDGSREALAPEEAEKRLDAMKPGRRRLYEPG